MYAAFHLGLHWLQKYSFRGFSNTKGKRINLNNVMGEQQTIHQQQRNHPQCSICYMIIIEHGHCLDAYRFDYTIRQMLTISALLTSLITIKSFFKHNKVIMFYLPLGLVPVLHATDGGIPDQLRKQSIYISLVLALRQ